MSSLYIFRNHAIEYLFKNKNNVAFSGYDEISNSYSNSDQLLFFYFIPYNYNTDEQLTLINDYYSRIENIVNSNKDKTIYIVTLHNYFNESLIFSDNSLNNSINTFNEKIYQIGKNTKIIDINNFFIEHPTAATIDMKYYYLYNCIIHPKYSNDFYEWFNKEIEISTTTRKKCLIVDLDNTIWGGILGEDGIESLKISGSYPGNAYNDFQKLILELKKIGIILCICTKNNEKDVIECFEKRDDLILKLDDFTICSASWDRKDKQMSSVIERLNISFDSVVFLDDNPTERELVKSSLKEITVLDFPEEPYLLTKYFSKEFRLLFGLNTLSDEDKVKSEQYKKKIMSDNHKLQFKSDEDFIKSLNLKIEYQEMNNYNKQRIEQLINKTNQFNLTTKRYDLNQLEKLKKDSLICCISVADKFGDLGITGIAIVKLEKDVATIDSFMLSCRILGKKIEYLFLKIIMNKLFEKNITTYNAKYIKSEKNAQTENFYENFGYEIISKNNNETLYQFTMKNKFALDKIYNVEE
ncbi:MAG: HAD-IIIC family phosphatase [Bacilli bacterium]|nr:HAD-IIIC family phosphatase [Bacilli bacterium]MDD4809217.1 HAD-IIIC family phosphatase [Bacilli bacterium]